MIPSLPKANVLGGLAAVAFALIWTASVFALGMHLAGVKADLKEVTRDLQSERKLQADKDRLRGEKEALQADMALMSKDHKKEMADAKETTDRLLNDLRAGRVRLSVPVVAPACPAGDGNPPTAPRDQEARAELAPEAAAAVAAIGHEGNDAIRDLNKCIDLYESARARLGKLAAENPNRN